MIFFYIPKEINTYVLNGPCTNEEQNWVHSQKITISEVYTDRSYFLFHVRTLKIGNLTLFHQVRQLYQEPRLLFFCSIILGYGLHYQDHFMFQDGCGRSSHHTYVTNQNKKGKTNGSKTGHCQLKWLPLISFPRSLLNYLHLYGILLVTNWSHGHTLMQVDVKYTFRWPCDELRESNVKRQTNIRYWSNHTT